MWITLTIVLATLAASFTDWLFMDALIHRFYAAHPDTWRPSEGAGRIIVSQVIGTATTAAAVLLCLLIPGRPLLLAIAVWAAGPLPVSLQTLQWMRVHPAITASHATGWLARLLIATFMAAWLINPHVAGPGVLH
jgi:hypothetical protein